jgi:hypothetical protein
MADRDQANRKLLMLEEEEEEEEKKKRKMDFKNRGKKLVKKVDEMLPCRPPDPKSKIARQKETRLKEVIE